MAGGRHLGHDPGGGVRGQLRRPRPARRSSAWSSRTGNCAASPPNWPGSNEFDELTEVPLCPGFALSAQCARPVEEVWKLLFDPARFPQWWTGRRDRCGPARPASFTLWPTGYPDFPMPQKLRVDQAKRADHDLLPGLRHRASSGSSPRRAPAPPFHVTVSLPERRGPPAGRTASAHRGGRLHRLAAPSRSRGFNAKLSRVNAPIGHSDAEQRTTAGRRRWLHSAGRRGFHDHENGARIGVFSARGPAAA